MRHLKCFENEDNINKLEKDLLNILDAQLYTEDHYELHYVAEDSKKDAVKDIIKYLIELGIDINVYFDAKKYNI